MTKQHYVMFKLVHVENFSRCFGHRIEFWIGRISFNLVVKCRYKNCPPAAKFLVIDFPRLPDRSTTKRVRPSLYCSYIYDGKLKVASLVLACHFLSRPVKSSSPNSTHPLENFSRHCQSICLIKTGLESYPTVWSARCKSWKTIFDGRDLPNTIWWDLLKLTWALSTARPNTWRVFAPSVCHWKTSLTSRDP